MSALVYISKDLSSMRRAKSSCGRCSSGRENRQPSPGRATYLPSERGRNLSLEIDGRQSRTSRRSTSAGRDLVDKSRNGARSARSAAYCFVVPYANGAPAVTSPTTYKDDYRSPFNQAMTGRRVHRTSISPHPLPSSRSTHNFRPSPSPSSSSQLSSLSSSKSFHSSMSRSITPTSITPVSHHPPQRPRSAMTRSATVDNSFGANKTTYMDHFSWNGYGTQV